MGFIITLSSTSRFKPLSGVIAGLTTFAMLRSFHQPALAASGMDKGAVFTATALASALGCLIMGIFANYRSLLPRL